LIMPNPARVRHFVSTIDAQMCHLQMPHLKGLSYSPIKYLLARFLLRCVEAGSGKQSKSLSATEARAWQWAAWARQCVGWPACSSSQDSEDLAGIAYALAAEAPYVVSISKLQIELLFGEVQPDQLGFVLNGALVGLLAAQPSQQLQVNSQVLLQEERGRHREQQQVQPPLHQGSLLQTCALHDEAQQQQQQQEKVQMHHHQPAPCLGVGLIRAYDGATGLLYVLTNVCEEQLQQVHSLQVGKLELPERLLATSQFATPYQSIFCLSTAATGAGQIKSRNNLLRVSLL
jgi:polynucleotide 5'-hydroxyl-kinase GRC3/NOL9